MFGTMLLGTAAWSALNAGLGALGGYLGNAQNAEAAKLQTREAARQFDENLAWQREQYQRTMDWQTKMANTAHQREIEDLRAAGLNPILTATGGNGAATGSMSSPSGVSPTASATTSDRLAGWDLALRAMNSAVDGIDKSVDLWSTAGLREAQAAESLVNAASKKTITPAMRDSLLQQANSAAANAHLSNIRASNIAQLTPKQLELISQQIDESHWSAIEKRKSAYYADARFKSELRSQAAQRDFMKEQAKYMNFNSAINFANAVSGGYRNFSIGRAFGRGSRFNYGFPELPRSEYPVQFGDPLPLK